MKVAVLHNLSVVGDANWIFSMVRLLCAESEDRLGKLRVGEEVKRKRLARQVCMVVKMSARRQRGAEENPRAVDNAG